MGRMSANQKKKIENARLFKAELRHAIKYYESFKKDKKRFESLEKRALNKAAKEALTNKDVSFYDKYQTIQTMINFKCDVKMNKRIAEYLFKNRGYIEDINLLRRMNIMIPKTSKVYKYANDLTNKVNSYKRPSNMKGIKDKVNLVKKMMLFDSTDITFIEGRIQKYLDKFQGELKQLFFFNEASLVEFQGFIHEFINKMEHTDYNIKTQLISVAAIENDKSDKSNVKYFTYNASIQGMDKITAETIYHKTFVPKYAEDSQERGESSGTRYIPVAISLIATKLNSVKASGYIETPLINGKKVECVNIKNTDVYCFKYCMLYHEFHTQIKSNSLHEVKKLQSKEKLTSYNWTGVSFPASIQDIELFEKNNNMKIRIAQVINDEFHVIKHVNTTPDVNLLYIVNDKNESHYAYIKNIDRTISNAQNFKPFLCKVCLKSFYCQAGLDSHLCGEVFKTKLLFNTDPIKFDRINKRVPRPFVVYADFEASLEPVNSFVDKLVSKHKVNSFAYKQVCDFDDKYSYPCEYYIAKDEDDNVVKKFLKRMINLCDSNIKIAK